MLQMLSNTETGLMFVVICAAVFLQDSLNLRQTAIYPLHNVK